MASIKLLPAVGPEISQVPTRSYLRDVALDPGGTTIPRITALHMLRSTMITVSAPARSSFRGSLPHPTQSLCTLRVRRHRRLTQHSLPGGSLGLTWAGLAPADRASFAWRLLSLDHLVGSHKHSCWHCKTKRLRSFEIDDELYFRWHIVREVDSGATGRWLTNLCSPPERRPPGERRIRPALGVTARSNSRVISSGWTQYQA